VVVLGVAVDWLSSDARLFVDREEKTRHGMAWVMMVGDGPRD